jgi:hypothetical protein
MHIKNDRRASQAWWLLGASGLLQPLSEDFLYRSPQSAASGSWRPARAVATARKGGRNA